ncbi:hypothetical protein MRX96_033721 [Rhipicephalus microplus]
MSSQDRDECETSGNRGESSVDEFVQAIDIKGARYYLHTVAKPSAAEPTEYELLLGDGRQCFAGIAQIPDGPEEKARAFHAALAAGGGREFVYRLRPVGEERVGFSWLRRVSHEMVYVLNEVVLRRDPDGGARLLAAANAHRGATRCEPEKPGRKATADTGRAGADAGRIAKELAPQGGFRD